MLNIIILVCIFTILTISLFNIENVNHQLLIFLLNFIIFLFFTICFELMIEKNKKNLQPNNNNYMIHLTQINNDYEYIDELYQKT